MWSWTRFSGSRPLDVDVNLSIERPTLSLSRERCSTAEATAVLKEHFDLV